ncbi:MAG: hypothetical protein AVDCRST_MAG01-01-3248 [uncultured Rubrobacteraceae bacterium]|uniref:Uncharacterized protein n=1 Tax=uncultured Rubrobacteraceae bacterium TaxID=349277 RepID=A0A6J4Q5Y6_9ACTN|nr:MAG: hypothetical protein AVDCRST_MAG01-01-3248 [uncultured Rubrobacteraceae bacterium]
MARTDRSGGLAEEVKGLARRNLFDYGEEIRMLVARNNGFHGIGSSGNPWLQRIAERAAEVPFGFGASCSFVASSSFRLAA